MKKFVFIAVLLISLGAAWTLYLKYSNRRFVGNLPKRSATVTQPADISDTSAMEYKNDQAAPVDSIPVESIVENAHMEGEHAELHAHPHASRSDKVNPPNGASVEKNSVQTTPQLNPVPPEVIEDSKRDLEWYQAMKEYEEEFDALREEWDELNQEFDSITSVSLEEIQRMGNQDKTAYISKLKAWKAKVKAWEKKDKELERERPIRPTPTHTH